MGSCRVVFEKGLGKRAVLLSNRSRLLKCCVWWSREKAKGLRRIAYISVDKSVCLRRVSVRVKVPSR